MKLTRYLLRATGQGHYGDSMERVMLNTVLGALPIEPDGHAFYYSDYNVAGKRVYSDHTWPCCAGTLPQVVADYGINSYLYEPLAPVPGSQAPAAHAGPAVWVNLYQPSTLRWTEGGQAAIAMQIVQTGGYPDTGDVQLRIHSSSPASSPVRMRVKLRVPAWAAGQAELLVNGAACAIQPVNGFTEVDRQWVDGDLVELKLPLTLRLEPLTGHPELVALLRGPVVLFPLRSPDDAAEPIRIPSEALLGAEQTGPRAWRVKTGAGDRIFVPFTEIGERPYSTYVTTTPA